MSSELAIPFRLNQDGRIVSEASPDKQIRQHVMSLINTEPGERVILADYGIPLSEALFEEGDDEVAVILGDTIQASMNTWEPGVVLRQVKADESTKHMDGLTSIRVEYARAESSETPVAGRSTNIAVIKVGGDVSEVVRG